MSYTESIAAKIMRGKTPIDIPTNAPAPAIENINAIFWFKTDGHLNFQIANAAANRIAIGKPPIATGIRASKVISEAKNQHIISIISGLEIFFTDLFIDLIDEYKFEYTQFNVKLDLLDLSEILKKKLTIGQIISEQFNFQNLDKINKAFSTLLNISFIEALKQAIKTEEYRNEINFLVLKDDFYQIHFVE